MFAQRHFCIGYITHPTLLIVDELFVFLFSGVTTFDVEVRFSVVCVGWEQTVGFDIEIVVLADSRSNMTPETIESRTSLSFDGNLFLSLST